MSLTSTSFIVFLLVVLIIYFIVPKKYQWMILLSAGLVFYALSGWKNVFYILFTSLSAYFATRIMQDKNDQQKDYLKTNKDTLSKEEKKAYKEKIKKEKRLILLITIIANMGLLIFFKLLSPINSYLVSANKDILNIVIPLGISYYSLQCIGYVADVYLNNAEAEQNYFKILLFVSFFPQMTQGPISDYKQLSGELTAEHSFTYKQFSYGVQRMVWGYFKKMVIADTLAAYVANLTENYLEYHWIALFTGLFFYLIRLYADFSGYMDIMCGYCEILGIKLAENFDRPFFSKSIAEFWRRWHITLGAWLRKYVYYPFAISKPLNVLGKKLNNQKLSSVVGLVFVWLCVGFWHGATAEYIVWGMLNGLVIIISMLLEPVYAKINKALHTEKNVLIDIFRMGRTALLFGMFEIITEFETLQEGFTFWKRMFSINMLPRSLYDIAPYIKSRYELLSLLIACILLLIFSLIQNKKQVRELTEKMPAAVRSVILGLITVIILIYGVSASNETGGFMYANF